MSANISDICAVLDRHKAFDSSSPWMCYILVGAIIYMIYVLYAGEKASRTSLSRIPGPLCLPYIGSILSVGTSPHTAFMRLWRRHGDVFRIQIGNVPIIILNGIQTIRKATTDSGDVFSGRPDLLTFKLASEGKSMAFNSYCKEWKIHRRLSERALRLLSGEGKFLEKVVAPEADLLAQKMIDSSTSTSNYNPMRDIIWSTAHVMYSMCYGNSRRSSDFECMVNSILKLIQCHKLGNAINFFPWLRHFIKSTYEEVSRVCNHIVLTTKTKEQEHLESYKEGELRDVMDALIRLGVKRRCPLEVDQVLHTVQEYIGAGLDIISFSLAWAVLYMAKYPVIREKMVEEIDRVCGKTTPTEDDLRKLPFTTAFLLETLRCSCVVPMTLPHATLEDITLNGYFIPSGTMILINLCSLHRDPEQWGDPDVFRPERFIDSTGQLDESTLKTFGAFGFGRRRCVGEQIGKQQLLIYIAILLQKCMFVDGEHPVHDDSDSGIVLQPKSVSITVKPRC